MPLKILYSTGIKKKRKKMSGQLIIGVGGNQSSSSSIPKNSVTSDMVKSIVVTDSAPIKEDNVLYFEYELVSSVVLRSSAEKKFLDLVMQR